VDHHLICIWDEGGVRGFTAADTRNGWIWALFVDPMFEHRGIGRALLPYACRALKDTGYARATLSTQRDTRAEGFYIKAGWTSAHADGDEVVLHARCDARCKSVG
jgi:GNAT superfamily N-acetyltransferase